MPSRLVRPLAFTLFGCAALAFWLWADPTRGSSDRQDDWPVVLAFSALVALLGVVTAVHAAGRASRTARLAGRIALAAGVLAALANLIEDGLGRGWAFGWFVASLAAVDLCLVASIVATALAERGRSRLRALVPAGTLAGMVGFVEIGGALLLATWLAAAVVEAFERRLSP